MGEWPPDIEFSCDISLVLPGRISSGGPTGGVPSCTTDDPGCRGMDTMASRYSSGKTFHKKELSHQPCSYSLSLENQDICVKGNMGSFVYLRYKKEPMPPFTQMSCFSGARKNTSQRQSTGCILLRTKSQLGHKSWCVSQQREDNSNLFLIFHQRSTDVPGCDL